MRSRSFTSLAVLVALVSASLGRCSPPETPPPAPTTTTTTTVPAATTTVPAATTTLPLATTTTTSVATGEAGARRPRTQADTMPVAATEGQPRIEQVRNGEVVATFSTLGTGGPFQRSHAFHDMEPGDVFLVYPAVYGGPGQYPWIGPRPASDADWSAGIFHAPTDITIRGVTVDGRRPVIELGEGDYNVLGHAPVEIEGADGLVIENIDIDGAGLGTFDRSGIYIVDSHDVTLRNMRIHGFQGGQHNGVFAAGANSGTLLLDDVRLYDNGGWDGPAHNAYINASTSDPDFTVELRNSFSSSVNVGHLFKSRAQVTVLDGNLLEGTDVPAGWDCTESFDLDVPDGGRITVTDNVFVKGFSGDCANGVLLRYAAEGVDPDRLHSVTVRSNTFIATTPTRDDFGHLNVPMNFFTPNLVPGDPTWPADTPVIVDLNRFEGFATTGAGPAAEYRGTNAVDVPA